MVRGRFRAEELVRIHLEALACLPSKGQKSGSPASKQCAHEACKARLLLHHVYRMVTVFREHLLRISDPFCHFGSLRSLGESPHACS
jgi:hypothetical protein